MKELSLPHKGHSTAISCESLLEHLYDGVYFVDRNRVITFWNISAERITGYSRDEVVGSSCADGILRHINEQGTELCRTGCPLRASIGEGNRCEAEVFLHHKSGHRVPVSVRSAPVLDDNGEIVGAVEIFTDMSKRRSVLQELQELRDEVYVDELTQVGNRKFANLTLEALLKDQKRRQTNFGILFADVDHFKAINDAYGHDVGDKVLRMVAKSVQGALREVDTVCRWGGEEFLVILPNVAPGKLSEIAERIRIFVEQSWVLEHGVEIRVTISLGGVSATPDEGPEDLVKRADSCMYSSKNSGRNCVTIRDTAA